MRSSSSLPGDGMPKGDDGRPDLEVGARMFIDVLGRHTAADLVPVLEQLAVDLVVYEQYDLGAAVAAHAVGIPVVCHSLSPRLPAEVIERVARRPLAPVVVRARCRLAGDGRVHRRRVHRHLPRRCCRSRRSSPTRHGCRCARSRSPSLVPSCRPGSVTRTGHSCTSRSAPSSPPTRCWSPSSTVSSALDAEVLVALGSADGAELGTLPHNVHIEPFVNQPAVLDLADLAVHHGGSGTLLAALASGIPQLLLPKGADQFFNADLVERAGLAPVLEPARVTPDSVAAAAADAMHRRRPTAAAVRQEMAAMPGPHEVLEQLVARFGRGQNVPTAAA